MGDRTDRTCRLHPVLAALAGLVLVLLPGLSAPAARAMEQTICDRAGTIAARERGIPVAVLMAITRTETGRAKTGPRSSWPWTSNVAGAGHWFDSRAEALRFLRAKLADGQRNFDVGCFQINYRWHHRAFASLDDMIDPVTNARYAARFLSELYAEKGNWPDAVGAYHSRTPKHASRYLKIYNAHHRRITGGGAPPPGTPDATAAPRIAALPREPDAPRVNTYPLFVSAGRATGGSGSLVALAMAGGRQPFLAVPGHAGRGATE